MWFVIHCLDKPDAIALRLATRERHLAYVREREADGTIRVLLAGPLLDRDGETMRGSLLLVEAESLVAAEQFATEDPYRLAGLFARVDVHPFRQVLPAT
jgi:uncharacterized protein